MEDAATVATASTAFRDVCGTLERNGIEVDHDARVVTVYEGQRTGLKLLGVLDLAKRAGYRIDKVAGTRSRRRRR